MVLGSPIIGIYLVAIPFIIIARTIGNFTLWVTELVIRNIEQAPIDINAITNSSFSRVSCKL